MERIAITHGSSNFRVEVNFVLTFAEIGYRSTQEMSHATIMIFIS